VGSPRDWRKTRAAGLWPPRLRFRENRADSFYLWMKQRSSDVTVYLWWVLMRTRVGFFAWKPGSFLWVRRGKGKIGQNSLLAAFAELDARRGLGSDGRPAPVKPGDTNVFLDYRQARRSSPQANWLRAMLHDTPRSRRRADKCGGGFGDSGRCCAG
jgi:hypothetical protein